MSGYYKITILPREENFKEVIIALLADAGYHGFEEDKKYLHAYIDHESFDEEKLNGLIGSFTDGFEQTLIPDTNWNAQWESSFEPVIVGNFCAVRASFHEPVPSVKYDLIVTPRMSFGTGHHATTYLMLETMQVLDFKNKTVLDFGTGTGVLAILSEKLGATSVKAIDNDEWSITNARENLDVNGSTKTDLEKADRLDMIETYDIILANINKHVILAQLHTIKQHLNQAGVVLLSGLLLPDSEAIRNTASDIGLCFVEQKEKDGWILIRLSLS